MNKKELTHKLNTLECCERDLRSIAATLERLGLAGAAAKVQEGQVLVKQYLGGFDNEEE